MLKFIVLRSLTCPGLPDFNTSHVKVYPWFRFEIQGNQNDFNTSHVKVYHNGAVGI